MAFQKGMPMLDDHTGVQARIGKPTEPYVLWLTLCATLLLESLNLGISSVGRRDPYLSPNYIWVEVGVEAL